MSLQNLKNLTNWACFADVVSRVSELCKSNGSFKTECIVCPPGSNVVAILDDAQAEAIPFSICLIEASNRLIRNVFPMPPSASRKYNPDLFSLRSGQVWEHVPEQRVAVSTYRRHSRGLRLGITQADAWPIPILRC